MDEDDYDVIYELNSGSVNTLTCPGGASKAGVEEAGYKDWMFMNYTFKRFEGLSLRGARPKATSVLGLGRSTSEQAPAREWL